jgi:hypothetical protein
VPLDPVPNWFNSDTSVGVATEELHLHSWLQKDSFISSQASTHEAIQLPIHCVPGIIFTAKAAGA